MDQPFALANQRALVRELVEKQELFRRTAQAMRDRPVLASREYDDGTLAKRIDAMAASGIQAGAHTPRYS